MVRYCQISFLSGLLVFGFMPTLNLSSAEKDDMPTSEKTTEKASNMNPTNTISTVAETSEETKPSNLSQSRAIERAASRLGLTAFPMSAVSARAIKLDKESMPFLGNELVGKTGWSIEFSRLDLKRHSGPLDLDNTHLNKVNVLLAPATGEVLKIETNWPKGELKNMPYPSRKQEVQQLNAIATKYTGLPTESPSVTFLEAIKASPFWDKKVKYIRAYYVLDSSPSYKNRPVWIIYLWTPQLSLPMSVLPGASTDRAQDFPGGTRNIVDPQTGKWLSADNVPQMTTSLGK